MSDRSCSILPNAISDRTLGKGAIGILRTTSRKGVSVAYRRYRHHDVVAIIHIRQEITIDFTKLLDVGSQNECRTGVIN
ncbi:hypothetical protein FM036_25780 [Nostoc sp. HG1]|nr:hypothetical protein [Nostoc sp. HG1]